MPPPSVNDNDINNASLESLVSKDSWFMFNSESLCQVDIDNDKAYIRLGSRLVPRNNFLTEADYVELPLYARELEQKRLIPNIQLDEKFIC